MPGQGHGQLGCGQGEGEALQGMAPAGPSSVARLLTHFSGLKETKHCFISRFTVALKTAVFQKSFFPLFSKLEANLNYPNTDPAPLQVKKVKDPIFTP